MSALHGALTQSQLSPPTLSAGLGKVRSWTCWRRWFITEWKECQNSTVQKLSFFTFLIPEDLIVTCCNANNYELPDLMDSWVTIQETEASLRVDSKGDQPHWLIEDLVLGELSSLSSGSGWMAVSLSHSLWMCFPLAGLVEPAQVCPPAVLPPHTNTLLASKEGSDQSSGGQWLLLMKIWRATVYFLHRHIEI